MGEALRQAPELTSPLEVPFGAVHHPGGRIIVRAFNQVSC